MAKVQFVSVEIDLRDIQDDVVLFVKETLAPDDVFDENALRKWALANGFNENE